MKRTLQFVKLADSWWILNRDKAYRWDDFNGRPGYIGFTARTNILYIEHWHKNRKLNSKVIDNPWSLT